MLIANSQIKAWNMRLSFFNIFHIFLFSSVEKYYKSK